MKKLKYMVSSVIMCCFLSYMGVTAYANNIKIGLEKGFKNVASISVNDNDINVSIGNGKKYNFKSSYVIKPISGTYYKIDEGFSSFDEAKKRLSAFVGYSGIPALTDSGWAIYIRTDSGKLNYQVVNTGGNCVGFSVNGVNDFIVDGSNCAIVNASDGIIGLGSSFYRDSIEIYRSGSTLTAINLIDEENYLYGVINSEMPSSWSLEAQKAQAVAARTYMQRNKGKHGHYDLCDGVHCQDYNGIKNETENGKAAVNGTKGLCIYYDDKLIEAVYFSSDGGATIDGEEAWGTDTPYLKGKADKYEKECKEWTREFTYSEITNLCEAKGYGIGNVVTVDATYNNNGVITSLTFNGSKGKKTIEGDGIRSFFSKSSGGSLLSRNFKLNSGQTSTTVGNKIYVLNSANVTKLAASQLSAQNKDGQKGPLGNSFMAESKVESIRLEKGETIVEGKPGVVTLIGKGYGHNVGMSQYGAKGMAEEGYKFDDILKFYYTGVEIK